MGIFERLQLFLVEHTVTLSIETSAAGFYIHMERSWRDHVTHQKKEDSASNYYDSLSEGLEDCLDKLEALEFHRNVTHLKVIK